MGVRRRLGFGNQEIYKIRMKHQYPVYLVCRRRKDGEFYGSKHFANNDVSTLCDKRLDQNWWILSNNHSDGATCARCLEINSSGDYF